MGVEGWARVEAVAPCPVIAAGSGRVVLGTMTHLNTFLREIRFQGVDPPLRTTASHRFFSEDRQDWASSDELHEGEKLRSGGGSVQIASITEAPGARQVFNLEVETDHVYYVGDEWVLAHNGCLAAKSGGEAVHFVYADGTKVMRGQQPPRLGTAKPEPEATGAHSQLRWDTTNNRVYQSREFDSNGNTVRDIDFTSPTYPSGRVRADHLPPPHQRIPNIPHNPAAGFRRSTEPTPLQGD